MLRNRVIPCLLVNNGRLVKTRRFRHPEYIGDPANAVRIFNEKEVDELLLLDISASRAGTGPNLHLIEEVAGECFMPLCYGGGIRTVESVLEILQRGVEKVLLGAGANDIPFLLEEAAARVGKQSIVVAVDVRRNFWGGYTVCTLNGTRSISRDPIGYAKEMEYRGAGELLLNSIDRDGTWRGYDLPLIEGIAAAVSIPVIACGGAGTLVDFRQAVRAGAAAVAAGSMFVFSGPGQGVLINFPAPGELEPYVGLSSAPE